MGLSGNGRWGYVGEEVGEVAEAIERDVDVRELLKAAKRCGEGGEGIAAGDQNSKMG